MINGIYLDIFLKYVHAFQVFPAFLIGINIGYILKHNARVLVWRFYLFFCLGVVLVLIKGTVPIESSVEMFIKVLLTPCLMLIYVMILGRITILHKICGFIGKLSLEIYLIHLYIIKIFEYYSLREMVVTRFWLYLLYLLTVIVIGYFVNIISKKILLIKKDNVKERR